jgi:hypothetical protein
MADVSGSVPPGGSPVARRDLNWFWREGRWPAAAWLGGIAAGAFWIYSGMPMICH